MLENLQTKHLSNTPRNERLLAPPTHGVRGDDFLAEWCDVSAELLVQCLEQYPHPWRASRLVVVLIRISHRVLFSLTSRPGWQCTEQGARPATIFTRTERGRKVLPCLLLPCQEQPAYLDHLPSLPARGPGTDHR